MTSTAVSQIQGGTVMALGGALFGPGASDCGSTVGLSLFGYEVPSAADAAEVDVVLLDRPDLPSVGVGETPLIALAPAIANAIFAVTGRRRVR
jgi:CO/xanthine dehydrogenase Mo-binding subunit